MLISNPAKWNIHQFLLDLKNNKTQQEDTWVIHDNQINQIKPGQYGIIRIGTDQRTAAQRNGLERLEKGIYAIVKIISYPIPNIPENQNKQYLFIQGENILKRSYLVRIQYVQNFIDHPITLQEASEDSVLNQEHNLINGIQRSIVEIKEETFNRILELKHLQSFEEDDRLLTESEQPLLTSTEKETMIKARLGHSKLRLSILEERDRCELCNVSNEKLLIISHIKPWRVGNSEERLDKENILLLCPNHDKLFDAGLITFDNDGKIIISEKLSKENRKALNVNEDMGIEMNDKREEYLKFHRERVFGLSQK